ncbi:hypothetical protein ACCO45_003792 [Purpureocillium lilacinum]|uniref:Uncharacterized protein n=1 Tax=Purpureocillium lilacinum TaxID=33203 RepID=A0ACC4E0W3_PURLI
MGIKGIYRELGPGTRVSLSKLAADTFEHQNRPFRIAIDIAIWQRDKPCDSNPFYRLVRLLGTPVQPIFVFDGPNKPVFKRNKRSGRGDGVATAQAKQLIRLFGFAVHDAPGEAEAECALLQKHGIVDAVLSEDVDTIMFGCTKTLRNWSSEGKTSKTPTHVSLYDVHDPKIAEVGLDREGMVLIALMSGGDYLPDGIPGCGVKVAYEAAKAGFGKSICRLKASDASGIKAWRESLTHQLRTNEQGHFRTKHRALIIPEDFPNIEVLRYYTHPVVSPQSTLDAVRQKLERKQTIQLEALREFTRETFDWDYKIGAVKFIRVLGQSLLVHNLSEGATSPHGWVKRISGRRQHFTTDATPELRLAYVPEEVVPIDLSKEVDEVVASGRDGLALNSDDDFGADNDPSGAVDSVRAPKVFDVTKPDLTWVLESVARRFIPDTVRSWEEAAAAKAPRKSPAKKTASAPKPKKSTGMPRGALDGFVRVTKPKPVHDETGRPAELEPGAKASQKPRLKVPPLLRSPPRPRGTYFIHIWARDDSHLFEPCRPAISPAAIPIPSAARRSRGETPSPAEEQSPPPSPSKKKKSLERSATLYWSNESEVDETERAARIRSGSKLPEARGVKAGVVRWSDVSLIDLTGDD